MRKHERTLKMIEEYHELRMVHGLSNAEIAKKFDLATWTVYHYIPQIARTHNVSPDTYKDRILVGHSGNSERLEPLDSTSFYADIKAARDRGRELEMKISKSIADGEEIDTLFEEEFHG